MKAWVFYSSQLYVREIIIFETAFVFMNESQANLKHLCTHNDTIKHYDLYDLFFKKKKIFVNKMINTRNKLAVHFHETKRACFFYNNFVMFC